MKKALRDGDQSVRGHSLLTERGLLVFHQRLDVGNIPLVVFPRELLHPSIVRRPPVGSAQRITPERGRLNVIYGEAQRFVGTGVVNGAFGSSTQPALGVGSLAFGFECCTFPAPWPACCGHLITSR